MELRQAKYFLAVCETLNFTRAARTCCVTQPALTRAIQRLEHELGGQLFRRERGRTHLTGLGSLLRPRVEELVKNCSAIKTDARDFISLDRAAVSVGIMCATGPLRVTEMLNEFCVANPGIKITLRDGASGLLVNHLLNGEVDIAVLSGAPALNGRLNTQPLYVERLHVAVPAEHRFLTLDSVSLKDLDGERCLWRMNCELQSRLVAACRERQVAVNEICCSEREDWIQLLACRGGGICFVPTYSAVFPGLQVVPFNDFQATREISAVTVRGRRFSPAVRMLVKYLKHSVRASSTPAARRQ